MGWLRRAWDWLAAAFKGRPVVGYFTLDGLEVRMAVALLTGQRYEVGYRAKYVRGDVPVAPDGPASWGPHQLPAGATVEVLLGALTARLHTGAGVGSGQVRASALVKGAPVVAVLDFDIAGGAVVAELVGLGPPVDE
jgi:hypothetical protein